jgi:ketosteroid isomerase-like protein
MATNTTDVLTQIEYQLAAAFVAADSSVHAEILSEEWSVIDPSGRIITKAEVLKESFTGDPVITECKIDQIKVRDYGDWAIVTGRTSVTGTSGGDIFEVTLRFTDVFSRESGEWQCVASQGTMLNEAEAQP